MANNKYHLTRSVASKTLACSGASFKSIGLSEKDFATCANRCTKCEAVYNKRVHDKADRGAT
jgi:hypothetical protein